MARAKNTPKAPEGGGAGATERAEAVLAAVTVLLEKDGGMDESGKPSLAAVSELTEFAVTQDEVDAALAALMPGPDGPEAPEAPSDLPGAPAKTAGEAKDSDGGRGAGPKGPNKGAPDFTNLPPSPAPVSKTVPLETGAYPTTLYHAEKPALTVRDAGALVAARKQGYRDLRDFPMPQRKAIWRRAAKDDGTQGSHIK